MRRVRLGSVTMIVAGACLGPGAARAQTEINFDFIASTAAHRHATQAYEAIWDAHGARIVAALEALTCLPFPELEVTAVIADASSHSGGPEHAMQLRASYADDVKRSTLVHELGHRHLWQLGERLDGVDGHRTLYLVLDRVWADVWGEEFAESGVRGESGWRSDYDYAAAWTWARALASEQRAELWSELLRLNGFPDDCNTSDGGAE